MHKSRKLLTAAAVSLALASSGAYALTLGDIEMRSALNQPMNAQIRLQPASPNEIDGLRVQLASPEAFARAGLDRNAALNDLQFSVDRSIPAQPVVRITSSSPVVEPFLNFLLEVDWPQGRMVREYTVLLDPPVFLSPGESQRATISDNTVTRATDLSGVPVAIERTPSVDTFDASSVAVLGGNGEVDDSLVIGNEVVGGVVPESLDSGSFQGEVVTLDEFNTEAVTNGSEVVILDENAPAFDVPGGVGDSGFVVQDGIDSAGEFIDNSLAPISGATDLGGEIVTLTDNSVDNFSSPAANFSVDNVGGFDVQVIGDTREVGDQEGGDGSFVAQQSTGVSSNASASGEVRVAQGDTLFEIARDNRAAGVTTEQMMLALLEANQQAFINGNINLVRAGSILRIPDSASVGGVSQAQALSEVADQEQLWREYRDSVRGSGSTRVAQQTTQPDRGSQDSFANDTDAASDTATSDLASDSTSDDGAGNISQSAQEILDQARRELEEARNELRLVGDNEATDTASSTSADETDQPDTNNLGQLNQELDLAREELAATKLKTDELVSRDEALEGTAERMDTLVNLRQDEVAKLEQQLADARRDADGTTNSGLPEVELFDEDSDAEGPTRADQQQAEATDQGEAAATDAAQTAQNASTSTRVVQPVQAEETQAGGPWYAKLLDNKLLIAGGIGLLALLGLFATMFKRRKNRGQFDAFDQTDSEDFMDDFESDETMTAASAANDGFAEGVDEFDIDTETQAPGQDGVNSGSSAAVAAGAGAAGLGAAAIAVGSDENSGLDGDEIDNSLLDQAVADGGSAETHFDAVGSGPAAETADGTLDATSADDTISEADVYLAYGLHGQAEDLLKKGISEHPDRAVYQEKLMQTYHAQNNGSAFDDAAADYAQRFGTSEAGWAQISKLGTELNPTNPLYQGGQAEVASLGGGDLNAPTLNESDFQVSGDGGVESSVREFSEEDAAPAMAGNDFMDQTIDPGAAFDETDLEATGDFTKIADEIRESSNDSALTDSAIDNLSESVDPTKQSIGDSLGFSVGGAQDAAADMAGNAGDAVSGLGGAAASGLGNVTSGLGDAASGLGDKASGLGDAASGLTDKASGLGDKASGLMDKSKAAVGGGAAGLAAGAAGVAGAIGLGAADGSTNKDAANSDLSGDDIIEFDTSIQPTELDLDNPPTAGASSLSMPTASDDLSLDLDQLSGDLEMDSADLAGGIDGATDLEIQNLTQADMTGDASMSLGGADEMDTMMDLAKAYIDMGDNDSASSALGEIVKSGNPEQRSEAETLLSKIS